MIPFKIKIIEKPDRVLPPELLSFKLQQEALKFNDIYVSCSSPKTDPERNFLNLENQNVEGRFFSIVTFR